MALERGKLLGTRYRIDSLVASGGMGVVYAATDVSLGRKVAVKVLREEATFDSNTVERFRREAQAAASLGHPNIVEVTDFVAVPGEPPFLVMSFIEGEPLSKLVRRVGPLDRRRAFSLALQIVDAVAAAHRAGIVHRDLKPANVMITRLAGGMELARVTDFGLAKFLTESHGSRITASGAWVGTPPYMAPEQLLGDSVDERADVYGAGAIVFFMLTGRSPRPSGDVAAIIREVLNGAPVTIASLRSDLPRAGIAAVDKALAREVHDRWQSASEFHAALEAAMELDAAGGTSGGPWTWGDRHGATSPQELVSTAPDRASSGARLAAPTAPAMGLSEPPSRVSTRPAKVGVGAARPHPLAPRSDAHADPTTTPAEGAATAREITSDAAESPAELSRTFPRTVAMGPPRPTPPDPPLVQGAVHRRADRRRPAKLVWMLAVAVPLALLVLGGLLAVWLAPEAQDPRGKQAADVAPVTPIVPTPLVMTPGAGEEHSEPVEVELELTDFRVQGRHCGRELRGRTVLYRSRDADFMALLWSETAGRPLLGLNPTGKRGRLSLRPATPGGARLPVSIMFGGRDITPLRRDNTIAYSTRPRDPLPEEGHPVRGTLDVRRWDVERGALDLVFEDVVLVNWLDAADRCRVTGGIRTR